MWAAACGFWRLSGVGHSFKAKPVHVSYYISTVYVMCRNRLLKMSGLARAFHLGFTVT